jgi:hypothetical protein
MIFLLSDKRGSDKMKVLAVTASGPRGRQRQQIILAREDISG